MSEVHNGHTMNDSTAARRRRRFWVVGVTLSLAIVLFLKIGENGPIPYLSLTIPKREDMFR